MCYYSKKGSGVFFESESPKKTPDPFFAMKLIDVTVPLDASLPVYPGNTPFALEAVKRIARGDSSNVSMLHMSAHAGTHVNAPRHYVGVTASGAEHLIAHGIRVVGVDYLTVEEFKKPGAPAHHVLLGGGAIIIEGLNLRDVDPGIYDMLCLPLRVVGADGAPARVLLRRT